MSMMTPLLEAKRMLEQLVNRLPKPLLDRLLALRRAYPTTPLTSLPEPIRHEVHRILTTASTGSPQDAIQRPALPRAQARNGHANGARARRQHTVARYPHVPGLARPLASLIGTDVKTGRPVVISQQPARLHTLYIPGVSGAGKTTMIGNLALQDINQGLGICLIEPHGDLTKTVLAGIPEHRLKDVVYLDVEDYESPFGLNLFETPAPQTLANRAATASFISHVFEALWNTGFETPRLMQNLRAVTRTLLECEGATFAEIPLLYDNAAVRARMLANLTNTQILHFWETFNRRSQHDRDEMTASTMNKVTAFLDEPMIKHILAQSKTTINFRTIMDEGKILLVKLSPQFEEASRLIGAVIIGKILMAAFSRADTPERERRQFNLYCDEFQRFATQDFAVLISGPVRTKLSPAAK